MTTTAPPSSSSTDAPMVIPASQQQATTAAATAVAVNDQTLRLDSSELIAIIVSPIIGVSLAIFAILIWRRKQVAKNNRRSSRTEDQLIFPDEKKRPPVRESWQSYGENTRRWIRGQGRRNRGPRQSMADNDNDEKTETVVIGAVLFPAEVSSPSELDASRRASRFAGVPGDAGLNALSMNPVIRPGRGPPLRLDTTHWPLT